MMRRLDSELRWRWEAYRAEKVRSGLWGASAGIHFWSLWKWLWLLGNQGM